MQSFAKATFHDGSTPLAVDPEPDFEAGTLSLATLFHEVTIVTTVARKIELARTGGQTNMGATGTSLATGNVSTLVSSSTTSALALDLAGGDAWAWVKTISGTCRGLDENAAIAILVDDARHPVRRDGDRFEATVPLKPGANAVQAMATLGQASSESEQVTHTARLSPRPMARISLSIEDDGVVLDGSGSERSGFDAASIVRYDWSLRGNDLATTHTIAHAHGPTATMPVPETDGEYLVSLTVTDEQERKDMATAMFAVERGRTSMVDRRLNRPAWTDGATVYGVVVRNAGPDGYQSVIDRLDDLAELGIAALWLAPINVTTPGDFGYGVVDYFDLRPEYGTRDDFKRLVQEAHARNIRVLMDVVPNHTSSEHPYYRDAQRNGAASPYHDFYDRDSEGKATHYFSWTHLPNLSFDNPEVRRFMTEALMYWVREYDVDGFRVDVAWGIKQRRPDFWPEFSAEFHRVKPDGLLIAEASARDPYYVNHGFDSAYDWTDELGVWAWTDVFSGETPIPLAIGQALSNGARGSHDPDSFTFRFLNNNDTGPRFITTHGVDVYRVATAMLLTLPGLPCVYTGDEVGAAFEPYVNAGPIDWADRHELRSHFRKLIHLRREHPALAALAALAALKSPVMTILDVGPASQVFGYVRHETDGASPLLVLLNFSGEEIDAVISGEHVAMFDEATSLFDLYGDTPVTVAEGSLRTISMPAWGIRILTARAQAPR